MPTKPAEQERGGREAGRVEVAPKVTEGNLGRFRTAFLGSTQGPAGCVDSEA